MTNTNHWYKNVSVKIKKGEVDIAIKKSPPSNAVVVVPSKPNVMPLPSKPWTSEEIVFVVGMSLVLLTLAYKLLAKKW